MGKQYPIVMLINRNINVEGHRTSIRLEPEFWVGLTNIARRERLTIDQLCTEIDRGAGKLSRTAAIRVFIASYMVRLSLQSAVQLPNPLADVEPLRLSYHSHKGIAA